MIDSHANIRSLPAAVLLATFNNLSAIVDGDEVKRFASHAVGIGRTLKMFDRVVEHRAAESYPVIAVTADGKVVNVEDLVEKAPPAPKTESAKPSKAKTGRAPAVAGNDVIVLLVAAGTNPKRATAAERFARYATGLTVAQYGEAVGSEKQAIRDVLWDKSKGWIEVVGAKSAKGKAALAARAAAPAA